MNRYLNFEEFEKMCLWIIDTQWAIVEKLQAL